MPRLSALFHSLSAPPSNAKSGLVFSGITVPNCTHHLAKDSQGRPTILFETSSCNVRPPSVALRNLRVDHEVRCHIRLSDSKWLDNSFSVIQCQSASPTLQECFLDLMEALLKGLPSDPTAQDVSQNLDNVAVLFQALERPPSRSIQGVWGELFIIVNSVQPWVLVECWHSEAAERYDFGVESYRLEVKTSGDRSRKHYFSFAQVYPPTELLVAVASLFTERATGGVSVRQLWDQAREAVGNSLSLRLKIDQVCIQSLGGAWEEALSVAFDPRVASQTLGFYDVRDIPRVARLNPDGVSDIRFRSDLSLTQTIGTARRTLGPILESIGLRA
jgi:hypothetical protein